MTDMIFVYVTCEGAKQAADIGRKLLEKRLCACINVIPETRPLYFWPLKSGKIQGGKEAVLIIKTLKSKYQTVEDEVHKLHSQKIPCIVAIPISNVSQKYYDWLKGEIR